MAIDWGHFSPASALAGGAMIGSAASLLWLGNGRIAGISGILGGLLHAPRHDQGWRLAFLAGLIVVPAIGRIGFPAVTARIDAGWVTLMIAGLLVGYGTNLGNGCTSGHGVCGLARLSPRSFAAVATFMASGIATVFLVRHVL